VLRRLGNNEGKTIIVSSHILPELADVCNKVGIIDRGVISHIGTVSEVMKQVRRQTILYIEVLGDLAAAEKLLSREDTVEKIEQHAGQLLLTLKPHVDDYSHLPTLLIQNGFQLKLFREEELNLETAFMTLTKGLGTKL
jgi:ABC-2 type transport system ATP-binding protein